MKSLFFTAAFTFIVVSVTNAQAQNSDFTNKLKPEYKLNLNPQSSEPAAQDRKKSSVEIEEELKNFRNQQKNVEIEISRMDTEGVSKEDNMYIKMQLSLKYLKGQIAEREKYLQHYQSK
jgi:hypothetical protein